MELSRDKFNPNSLPVLDMVARLLYLSEQAMSLGKTFANNDHIPAAEPEAKILVDFAREVSVGLIGALFHTTKNRRLPLKTACDEARSKLPSAISAAEQLSAMEKRDTDGEGNVMSVAVLPYLKQMCVEIDDIVR